MTHLVVCKKKFTTDQLFQVKKKDMKSTDAHLYSHVFTDNVIYMCFILHIQLVVRDTAKSVGIWDMAPILEKISKETIKEFEEVVSLSINYAA